MVVDALVLLGENRFGRSLAPTEALELADREGVDTLVAAPARPLGYHLEPANEALAAACAASSGRLVLLGRVDPLGGDAAVEEARRCIDDLGARGLFLHPGEEAFPVTRAANVVRVAADRDVPVVVATGYFAVSEPLQVAELAAQFPQIPIVMTNGGQINISGLSMVDAWAALRQRSNLHVLTNGEYRQDFIERLADALDHRRVLYASFAPVFDFRFERLRIRAAQLSDEALRAVERDNAERIFGLA
jgi:predicted TIM-barrel fold metal-dependent hydrolase